MEYKFESIDDVLKYSLQCKTRTEFRFKYERAYNYARKMKILDDVCNHMIIKSYSTPQLILKKVTETLFGERCQYNDRKLIKPYEIDVLFKNLNIAFEYNGSRWHMDDRVNKYELCDNQNVILIVITENNKDYESDVKNQLINNLDIINEKTNKSITPSDVLHIVIDYSELIPNLEHIKSICLKYNDLGEFIKSEGYFYQLLYKRKLLKDFTSHMKTSRTNYNNIDIPKVISKYVSLNEFIKKETKLYQHIKKNKLEYLLGDLFKNSFIWSKELIIEEISKYEFLNDFKKNTRGCYNAAIKMGLINELKVLKKKKNTYTKEFLIKTISKYTKLIDLINNDFNVYTHCLNNNFINLYSHLEKRKKWSEDELIDIINSCKNIKELSINHPRAYSCIRRRYKYLLNKLKKYER
jgi:hypothetical protein